VACNNHPVIIMKKGQVSTELLLIVGIVLLIFIPLLTLVYFKASEANEQVAVYQAEMVVFRLAHLSNSVGSLGTDTKIYTDLYVPQNTVSLETSAVGNGGEITLKLATPEGETEIVDLVKFPISDPGVLVEGPNYGWKRFEITSTYDDSGRGTVSIARVS